MLDSLGNGVKKRFMTSSSMDMGYQRQNITWPQDPLVLWMRGTLMIRKEKLNSQQRELRNITWTIKRYLIDRANHEFYKPHFKKIMTSRQILKWNLIFGSTSYFLKDFISKYLENIKDSLIIAAIEEGTPNTSMITTIKTFKAIFQAGTKGMIKTYLLG